MMQWVHYAFPHHKSGRGVNDRLQRHLIRVEIYMLDDAVYVPLHPWHRHLV